MKEEGRTAITVAVEAAAALEKLSLIETENERKKNKQMIACCE